MPAVSATLTTDDVLIATGAIAAAVLVVGCVLLFRLGKSPAGQTNHRAEAWRALGSSMITGAAVTFAIFALQLYVDKNSEEEDFRLKVAMTGNLSGFDPKGHPLDGMHLAGKALNGAAFEGASLRGTVMRDASLVGTSLKRAHLEKANLINADLTDAILTGASLDNADLRNARFVNATISDVASWKGAKVNFWTCWPRGFDLKAHLDELIAIPTRPGAHPQRGQFCEDMRKNYPQRFHRT
jgi:pentapeptide repeat protein